MKIKAQIDRMVGENNRIKAYASVILGGEYVEKRLKGSKAGDKRFYEKMIPVAEQRFARHLKREGEKQ